MPWHLETDRCISYLQDTEIWTVSKLPFCQEHLAHPFTHMPQ